MKLISWNVNGIRAAQNKGFMNFATEKTPDVLCIQETKAQPDQIEIKLDGYTQFWNSAEKKGYAGTAIFTRAEPISISYGMGIAEHDGEGRVITMEFDPFFLVNVYTPNAQRGLTRLDYRMQWDKDFGKYLKTLEKTKPVIFCGDLNVAHKEIDLANPNSNRRNAGFTDEERHGFSSILEAGFVDTFRMFNTDPNHYTWWSYMFNARAKNIGWRIDYFCCTNSLSGNIKNSYIMPDIMGSDHCPIGLEIDL